MNDHWKEQLRESLQDYRQEPPEGLLDDIRREMSRRDVLAPVPTPRRKSRVVNMYIRRVAAVALLCVIAAATLYLFFGTTPVPPGHDAPVLKARNETPAPSQPVREQPVLAQAAPALTSGYSSRVAQLEPSETSVSYDLSDTPDQTAPSGQSPLPEESDKPAPAQQPSGKKPVERSPRTSSRYAPAESHHGGRASGFSAGIYFAGQQSGGNSQSQPGYMAASYGVNQLLSDGAEISSDLAKSYQPVSSPGSHYEHVHHKLPVKVGLSVNYRINNRWSIQSGVTYSYHSSDVTISSSGASQDYSQKLHFVGIPLSASYSLWQSRHFNVYVNAGGEAEKMVHGKLSPKSSGNSGLQTASPVKVHMGKLQWSAKAAAGVEYKAGNVVSIYAEPGAAYYFDNGSDLRTYYSDHPWNFNLNVGVRLNINGNK